MICDSLFFKLNDGIFTKSSWNEVTGKLYQEMVKNKVITSDLYRYIESSLNTICKRRKKNLGIEEEVVEPKFYNWLEV